MNSQLACLLKFLYKSSTLTSVPFDAEAGVSVVEIGTPAWIGLLLGIIVGTLWGMLAFSGRVPIPGIISLTLSAGLVAVIFLWAGIFACIGWLIGALVPLFRTPTSGTGYELRATVTRDTFVNVERELAQAGALDVVTFTDGRYSYEPSNRSD